LRGLVRFEVRSECHALFSGFLNHAPDIPARHRFIDQQGGLVNLLQEGHFFSFVRVKAAVRIDLVTKSHEGDPA